jgi:hypothetical protein
MVDFVALQAPLYVCGVVLQGPVGLVTEHPGIVVGGLFVFDLDAGQLRFRIHFLNY